MEKVELYDNIYLETSEGLVATNRVKLFIPLRSIEEDGSIGIVSIGNQLVDNERGYTFIVEDYVCKQFEKLRIITEEDTPILVVKEGESLINDKTPEEIELDKLRQELAQKEAEMNSRLNP